MHTHIKKRIQQTKGNFGQTTKKPAKSANSRTLNVVVRMETYAPYLFPHAPLSASSALHKLIWKSISSITRAIQEDRSLSVDIFQNFHYYSNGFPWSYLKVYE